MRRAVFLQTLCALAAAPALAAQQPAAEPARRQATAVRIEGRAPTLDGRLDEPVWSTAPAVTDFTQKRPAEGATPTERTAVRFVYDGEALYVGARMHAADPRAVQAPVSRRDNVMVAEYIRVSLDTYHDRRTAYSFGVTAAGTRVDGYHPRDSESMDFSFNPVWEAEVARDSAGWTAELRIPFTQLRFNPGSAQTWGLNLNRWIPSREEDLYWVMVPADTSAWSSRFGELAGISGIRPTRRVELMPYVATGADFRADVDPDDPFTDAREASVRVGGDLKLGLGPNLTLDATVNPDFGQVEADPAEVNLSAFETFFPERRPFFTEGSQLLSGGGSAYFYSRRIGAAPRGAAEGDYVDRPEDSTILGAAKVTGRLPSGLAVGVLAAVTDRERARVYDAGTDRFGRVEVEPRAAYGVVRLQQQFGAAGSTAGVMLTGVGRGVDEGTPLAARLPESAVTGGADFTLRLAGGAYELGGSLGFSHVAGDSLAILRLQRSSARYFQRPDADHVELDPSRTTLSGYVASLGVAKLSGKHWLWEAGVASESPGFDLNDAGQLSTADDLSAYAQLRYRETQPKGPFRRYDVYVTPEGGWNHGGVRTSNTLWLDWEATWKNYWRHWLTFFYTPRAYSDELTRGGPLAATLASWAGILEVSTRASSPLVGRGRVYYGENEVGTPIYRLSGGISVRPGPRWQLSIDPNYLRQTPLRQYITTFDGGPAETFGRRYVFSAVDRSEFFAQIRLNYLFTPDLSLELYAEPFASSGRFRDFGEMAAPRTRDLAYYGSDTTKVRRVGNATTVFSGSDSFTVHDFSVRSFRSNAVLRWEWRPGSTLYVVWQQDRAGERERIGVVGPGALVETLDAPGDNYLAVKLSYWLPVR
ncbi:MAG TPA: DUF5916 domain-containing protein [Longimicrobiaceae bacterium]|nr:DUF5916 domain-containing protein [Longimicrobiaceae bacterium]